METQKSDEDLVEESDDINEKSKEQEIEKIKEECRKKCQFHSTQCNNHVFLRDRLGCIELKKLKEDVGSIFGANIVITEHDLICMRSKTPLDSDDYICATHQFRLGKGYQPSSLCKYLKHPESSVCKGRKVSWELYEFVKSFDKDFVLGSLICKPCQTIVKNLMTNKLTLVDANDDPDYVPEIQITSDQEKLSRRTQLDSLTAALNVDRVRFQINSPIEDLAPNTLNYFRKVHQSMLNNVTSEFCRFVAYGQEEKMKEFLLDEATVADPVITHLQEAFHQCITTQARRAVLTLVPKSYSEAKVSELFDCTIYEITKARSVLKLYGTCGEEPKEARMYSRLSVEKAKHFIDFLLSTGLLQEVAYGTTKLKFESGDKLTVSNTILNGLNEHAVKQYKIYCKEISYNGLGRSTLLNILTKMKPHIRKKLAGIDTFVVDGIEAFECLRQCLKLLSNTEESKKLLKDLNQSECYLKARFKMHCKNDDSCISHCIDHALSHPTDTELISECKNVHDRYCKECITIAKSIDLLKEMLTKLPQSHGREVALWEVANAKQKIFEWKKHILRGVQQSKARTESFRQLGPSRALWIRDMAQKVNPSKTLESMDEYFGKRGITVSVEVFLTKPFETYMKQVYLVGIDRSDQGTLDTLCIGDIVLEQFTKDNPHVTQIDLKTDNAGNYHANGVPECMQSLGKKLGISIGSYNYNEAQLGKDQCDREAAFFKKCAEQWLLKKETNKISTANELTHAIFAEGGPKNTKMCVIQIDQSVASFDGVKKINNISYYHSVKFKVDGALYQEYYNIGAGKFYKYNDIRFVNGASFLLPWTNSSRQDESMVYDSRNQNRSFTCPDTLCTLEFENENDLLNHVEKQNHKYVNMKNNMDKAIFYYAQRKDVCSVSNDACSVQNEDNDIKAYEPFRKLYTRGWARKIRRTARLFPKQKQFIEQLFYQGANKKSKLSAEQMSEKMKNHMVNGEYYFRPEEYLQVSQIRNLISRIKKQDIQPQNNILLSEDDGLEQNLEEICDEAVRYVDIESNHEDFFENASVDCKNLFMFSFRHQMNLQSDSDEEDFLGFDVNAIAE